MFLSLALTMILSLVFTLLESARLYGLEAQSKMETELLLESKMAEYDTALLEQYHLYFLEAGRKGELELSSLEQSLQELGEENLRAKPGFLKMSYTNLYEMQLENCYITNYTMATDDAGAEFRRQAADYVKRTMGIAAIEKLYEKATEAKELTEDNKDIEKKFEAAIQETDIQSGLERNTKRNSANQKNENPLDYVKELKNKSILSLVVEDVSAVSTQTIDLSDDIAKRTCFTGNGEAQQEDMTTGLFFREYLLKQFSDYRNQSESEVLQYEMEYLIAGKDSDVANLAGVAERMLAIREVANYIYLKGDAEKTALANTIALVTAGWTANPAVVKVVEEGILVAWAFSESIKDVKTLLKGGKVPFLKGNAEWTLDVGALSESFAKEEESKTSESGLSYGDYLRILLYLTGQEKLTYRAMNLMEQNIRRLPDRENFRMDCMIGSMEIQCSYLSKPLFFGWFGSGESFKGDYRFQEKNSFSYVY